MGYISFQVLKSAYIHEVPAKFQNCNRCRKLLDINWVVGIIDEYTDFESVLCLECAEKFTKEEADYWAELVTKCIEYKTKGLGE